MPFIPVFVLLLLVAAIIYGISCMLFHFIFYRPKRSTKVPKFYVDSPHYKVSRAGMALMKNLPCEDVFIHSRDNLKLHAYLFPVKGIRKKFVLGIHGYKSYARPEYGPYVKFYRDLGYNLIIPDDRAHAPSEGKYIGFGVLDRLDCIDWANYLVSTYGEDIEIILHGVSMGGATVLAASGEKELPPQVKGIVSDCGFTSAWDALSGQMKNVAHLPVKPFLPLCEQICKHRAGFGFHEHAPIEQVKKATVPILFVQGAKDWMVPAHMAEELYEACASEKRLLMVDEADHAESIAFEPEKYHDAIHELFHIPKKESADEE